MNKSKWASALGLLDDDILEEAVLTYGERRAALPCDGKDRTMNTAERFPPRTRGPSRAARLILLAAALAAALTVGVFAAGRLINSPQQAWRVAQTQVARWQELGLLTDRVELAAQAGLVIECPPQSGDDYWYGRLFPHRYAIDSVTEKYHINMQVDTFDGKITKLSIEAYADESDTPVSTSVAPDGSVYAFYDNYDDILSPDMTVDRFCSGLAEYWGFTGYTLGATQDSVYGYDSPAPAGETLLTELDEEAYLTVYFHGDQSGVPMYVQLARNAGSVYFTAGTNHLVG